jgi:Sec-independent protein secretion pathway component TatC
MNLQKKKALFEAIITKPLNIVNYILMTVLVTIGVATAAPLVLIIITCIILGLVLENTMDSIRKYFMKKFDIKPDVDVRDHEEE